MKKVGLILEGGGLRGVYTAGILDYFMEKDLYFPYIIGVSAGTLNSLSYISRQIGRSKEIAIDLTKDKKLINRRNILNNKDVFGFDYYFNEISQEIYPFDYKTFNSSKEKLIISCTDLITGKPVYFDKSYDKINEAVKASSSLPIMNSIVKIDDKELLDGSIVDPIPIDKAISDGYEKNVIILTNHNNFRQKQFKLKSLIKMKYPNYKKLLDIFKTRHDEYNKLMDKIYELEKRSEVFIFCPSEKIRISKYKRNEKKLRALYNIGYNDASKKYDELIKWLGAN